MNGRWQRILFWTPRVLCMLLAAFLSIFGLDVLDQGLSVGQTILGMFMYLLPGTFLVIIVLVISWRREWVGAVVYGGLGIIGALWAWNKFPDVMFMISGALLVIGILFAQNAIAKRRGKKIVGAAGGAAE